MALKKRTVERVQIRESGGDTIITVSKDIAEMLLRNKGEYELIDAPTADPKSGKRGKKGGGESSPETGTQSTPTVKPEWPAGTGDEWAAFAATLGISTEGLDRNAIHAAVVEHEEKANQPS